MGAFVALLVLGMLSTGCLNTLLLKFQDQTCDALVLDGRHGCASFPVLQSLMMFIGESLCFLAIGLVKLRHYYNMTRPHASIFVPDATYTAIHEGEEDHGDAEDVLAALTKETNGPPLTGCATLYLALPAICDICGTTIGSIGLLLVPASIYQMCRGSLVLYVGILSVLFLGRRLAVFQWLALVLVTSGVFIVGLSNVVHTGALDQGIAAQQGDTSVTARNSVLGILLITGAQLFTATQFVLEEWILSKYSVEPLKIAGLEGVFGTLVSVTAIVLAYWTFGRTSAGLDGTFDVKSGIDTIFQHASLWSSFLIFAVSIASFNFFGLSVTRSVSATSRSTIDTCRTLFIWAVSMMLGWERFKILQMVGFIVLVYATLLFNGVIQPPSFLQGPAELEVQTGREHTLE